MGRRRSALLVAVLLLLAATGACSGDPTAPRASPSPSAPASASPTTAPPLESPSPPGSTASPSTEPSPSPEPDPLGRSRAELTITGDIATKVHLTLAALDSFSATWCDARDCANATNSLQLMGEGLGTLGTLDTSSRALIVTIEVQDRFLYVSGEGYTQGDCTVTFTVADERGIAGEIVCRNITNGTGVGILTLSVRGDFVAAY